MTGLPKGTPSIWNSTLITPTLSLALALKATVPPSPLAKAAGALMVTVGGWVSALGALTVTATTALVVLAPWLSVARALRLRLPAALGVQFSAKGALVSSPSRVVPSKNCTRATLPSLSLALAVSVTATPVVAVAGALSVTLGAWLSSGPRSTKVATRVVSAAGVDSTWLAAPPSLQLAKR